MKYIATKIQNHQVTIHHYPSGMIRVKIWHGSRYISIARHEGYIRVCSNDIPCERERRIINKAFKMYNRGVL